MHLGRLKLHLRTLHLLLTYSAVLPACYANEFVTNGISTLDPQEILRSNALVTERLEHDNVSFVQKMSTDEGEKFWLGYWGFSNCEEENDLRESFNARHQARAAALVHSPFSLAHDLSRKDLNTFDKRDFKCPVGTSSCLSIDRPASCCDIGDTCQIIPNTGLGDVGCCPGDQNCSGEISSCASGYEACSPSLGGGCCIPGYECVSGGCAFVATSTVSQSHSTVVASSTVESSSTTSSSSPSLPSSSSSFSSSTGTTSTTESTSTTNLIPPVRPTPSATEATTSSSLSISSSSTTGISISNPSGCPTGFYACSAVYLGGCCRVGRNCDTTSCPATDSTALLTSDGITIVAPTGPAAGLAAGSTSTGDACASGWFGCAASQGGGCCPSGFACGSSCVAPVSGTATATVAKEAMQSKGSKTAYLPCLSNIGWMGGFFSILLVGVLL